MNFPDCGKFFKRTLMWSFLLFGIVECLAVTAASANPLPQIPNTAPTKAPAPPPVPAAPSAAQATKPPPPAAAPASVVATTTDGPPPADTAAPYSDPSGAQNKPHANDPNHPNLGSTHAPFAPWDTFFRPQNNTPQHQKPFQITWVPLGQLLFNGFQKLFQPNHNENNHFDNHHG